MGHQKAPGKQALPPSATATLSRVSSVGLFAGQTLGHMRMDPEKARDKQDATARLPCVS